MVASTVLAATPGTSGGLLNLRSTLGSLGLGGQGWEAPTPPATGLSSLSQQVCGLLPLACRPGTQVFEIPTGVLTLGMPTHHAAAPAPVLPRLPATGCLLGLIGNCSHPTSTPAPKATAAATVSPAPSSTAAATPTTTTTTTTTAPASTATPAPAGGGLLGGLLGSGGLLGGLLGGTSNSAPTPAPAPSSNGLCVLSCNLLQLGGSGGTLCLLQSCLLPTTPASPPGGSSGGGGGACVGTLCLLGSSCTLSVGTGCLVGALLPGLSGLLPGSPSGGSSSPGSSSPGGSSQTTGGTGGGTGSISTGAPGGVPLFGIVPTSSTQASGSQSQPTFTTPQTPGGDATVGLVNGISFGHGLILWPLFGLLDLAALAGLVVVVRRSWSATRT
jgi:hypothetical protein